MTRRTFQPKTKKRMRKIGFLTRMKSSGGRATIQRRRNKGRKKLTS
ncbi:MAG: 50S ribosomal protein L34 [Candidatus Roizmanbacteria bacterium GW2011_GWA2_37_7]|uniref:Large ribosomal subunit protein bL34 n=1 Tax=Candidatus Roizmanbacteria bacterium GW2011_GWA2_37_7 TaxID=1618481 RepID=A0A0G0JMF4_9BACT|nr:MAG: 50S ribosomal protein L34 [Candidatus Roizmanbacteria bacterium GW2011_GWA2_37_7]